LPIYSLEGGKLVHYIPTIPLIQPRIAPSWVIFVFPVGFLMLAVLDSEEEDVAIIKK